MSQIVKFNKRFYFAPGSEEGKILSKLYLSAFDIDAFNKKRKQLRPLIF